MMRIHSLLLSCALAACHTTTHSEDLGEGDQSVVDVTDILPPADLTAPGDALEPAFDGGPDGSTPLSLPAAVIAAGCTKQVFFDDFDDLSSIDVDDTRVAGFKWYVYDPAEGTVTPKANLSIVKLAGVTSLRIDPKGGGVRGATRSMTNAPIGTGFNTSGGKCMYIEGRVAMGLADKTAKAWPAFWMNPTTHVQNFTLPWAGDTVDTSYEHYVEMDIMELTPRYGFNVRGTLIDWYGDFHKAAQACGHAAYCNVQDGQGLGPNVAGTYDSTDAKPVFHRVGALWIPSVKKSGQATQTQGAIHWYTDGVELGKPVTWTGPPSTTVFAPEAPWTYSVLDSLDMSLLMNNGGGAFMDIDYASIWQTP